MSQRALTEREKEFVVQARSGDLGISFDDHGRPFARSGVGNRGCFADDLCVVEADDRLTGGYTYSLEPDEDELP